MTDAAKGVLENINGRIDETSRLIDATARSAISLQTGQTLEEFENKIGELSRTLAGLLTARALQEAIASEEMTQAVKELLRYSAKYRYIGWRSITISLKGGLQVAVSAPYYARRAGGKDRKGFYPALVLMGILDRCSAGLASMVAMFVAALSSLEEARNMLSQQGVVLDVKTIRNITKAFAQRARTAQNADVMATVNTDSDKVADGRSIVISTDGGRIRIRRNKRGPKTKKGRTRYHTDWREPKVIIIYVANESGSMEKTVAPIIDATMCGPDNVFSLLAYYLAKIGIQDADKILFIADGARWIWDRVSNLFETLGITTNEIYELLDFYHVVEHLSELARLVKGWTSSIRKKWVSKLRRRFVKGKVSEALEEIKEVVGKTRNTILKRERDYFLKNAKRLHYAAVSAEDLPMGSGAIESAVRRVINLRMKGPGIFWHEDTAEEVMFLRCYYKAGRWGELVELAYYHESLEAQAIGGM